MSNKSRRDNTIVALLKDKAGRTYANITVQTDHYLNNFVRGKPEVGSESIIVTKMMTDLQ